MSARPRRHRGRIHLRTEREETVINLPGSMVKVSQKWWVITTLACSLIAAMAFITVHWPRSTPSPPSVSIETFIEHRIRPKGEKDLPANPTVEELRKKIEALNGKVSALSDIAMLSALFIYPQSPEGSRNLINYMDSVKNLDNQPGARLPPPDHHKAFQEQINLFVEVLEKFAVKAPPPVASPPPR